MKKKGKMNQKPKQLSNSFSTGGGGVNFETRVQTAFVALMLTGGFAPCLPTWTIKKIKLQGKYAGYETDDLIVFVESADGVKRGKVLGQVKHTIKITEGDKLFGEVIQAAWRDFKNTGLFTKGSDIIALITGPLSATDTNDVRTLLERARHSEDAADFMKKVNLANFSSASQRKKLKVFQVHLKSANGGTGVSDDELWSFMRSFHLLGYDLDIKTGVTLSLLQSLIGLCAPKDAQALWAQIVDEVQAVNQNSGTITIDSLPDELRSAFQKRAVESIPAAFVSIPSVPVTIDWNKAHFAAELAIVNLLGSWDEKNTKDKVIAGQLASRDFTEWIATIREILQQPHSPLNLKNGQWTVTRRLEMWKTLGQRLFDDHLDRLNECAIDVLTERDPQFELPPDERYAASIHGKVLIYSNILRKGLAESLALLGSHPKALNNCSLNKAEATAVIAVRKILCGADWILWGSIDNLLPMLAEAAPGEFLNAVDDALQQMPCPFDNLFSQEGNGITGRNYMTGLLWALETLAWDEIYISTVTVILGELASHDPGGQWVNRPANSLKTIFLPWLPQTIASFEKRKSAIRTLQKEIPEIAWNLLLHLLPSQHQMSSGSRKPAWRETIPEGWSKEVSQQEYWDQVLFYADMTYDAAKGNISKLVELIGYLDNLPEPTFEKLLAHLRSEEITGKPEEERFLLWTKLVDFVSKHKRHADAKWVLSPDLVENIEKVAACLAPQNPGNLYRRLFSQRDFDLYEEKGNWKEQQEKLGERRNHAIQEILATDGLGAVIEFAKSVESSYRVGFSLGFMANAAADSLMLPDLLNRDNKKLMEFVGSFVWGRYQHMGWKWVDQLPISGWTRAQTGQFFTYLPFIDATWRRVEQRLGTAEIEYWKNTSVNPYQTEEADLNFAIDKLIEHGRPNEAISCLSAMLNEKKIVDQDRAAKALLAAVSSPASSRSLDAYEAIEIIKALQEDPKTNPDDLFRIEWAYLPLLDEHRGASPKLLEQRLASDPNFFCEAIRLIYRSKKEDKSVKEPTEQQQAIATNAYSLLDKWRTPPGIESDGSFSGVLFNQWLGAVKEACLKSGHLDVALIHVGNVLIHCPQDPDGLWIHHAAATALNAKDAEKMRNGFRASIFNSRGVHWVDPTAKPERELAAKYRQQGSEVENCGYQRLAATLREVADSYDREVERIIAEHKRENEKQEPN
jgi:hypothetical protein